MLDITVLVGEGSGTPLQYSCLKNPMDRGAWWATVHRITKSRTRLTDFIFTFHFHALEKEMATHSSVLAWRIPGMVGAWWAAVYGVAQNRTRLKRLSSSSNSMYPWWTLYKIFVCHIDVWAYIWKMYMSVPLTSNRWNNSQISLRICFLCYNPQFGSNKIPFSSTALITSWKDYKIYFSFFALLGSFCMPSNYLKAWYIVSNQ